MHTALTKQYGTVCSPPHFVFCFISFKLQYRLTYWKCSLTIILVRDVQYCTVQCTVQYNVQLHLFVHLHKINTNPLRPKSFEDWSKFPERKLNPMQSPSTPPIWPTKSTQVILNIHRVILNIPRSSWTYTGHPDHSQVILNIHRSSWTFTGHPEHSQVVLNIHRSSWTFTWHPEPFTGHPEHSKVILNNYRSSWTFKGRPEHSQVILNIHRSSWTFTGQPEYSKVILNIYRSSWTFTGHPSYSRWCPCKFT